MDREKLHIIIKAIFSIVLLGYIVTLCLSDSAKDVPMKDITATMTEKADLEGLNQCGKTELIRFYGLQEKNLKGFFFYKAPSPMAVDEILIVKSASKTEASQVLETMQARLDSQKNIFEGYGTDQIALLNNAVVASKGNYSFYMCGKNVSKWRDLFLSLI